MLHLVALFVIVAIAVACAAAVWEVLCCVAIVLWHVGKLVAVCAVVLLIGFLVFGR